MQRATLRVEGRLASLAPFPEKQQRASDLLRRGFYGLRELWSEDFQHDRLYGSVRIVNPFL